MMRQAIWTLILAVSLSWPAWATEPDRTLQHSTVISASADELWQTLTTPEGWIRGFGVAKAEVDLRLGGMIRTHYDPAGTLGNDATIVNTILAYEPVRMLAIKATAPGNAPDWLKQICETGWSVIRLEPLTPTRTRLVITGMGYGEGPLYDQARRFFDQGNAWTLEHLRKHFEKPEHAEAVAAAEAAMKRTLGTWEFSRQRPDGGIFRGRTQSVELFGGKVLFATGYLGDADSLFQHSHFLAARDPRSGVLKIWNFNEHGDYTEGEASMQGEQLVLDWQTTKASDGSRLPLRVEYTFDGDDAFWIEILRPVEAEPGTMASMIKVRYTRAIAESGQAAGGSGE